MDLMLELAVDLSTDANTKLHLFISFQSPIQTSTTALLAHARHLGYDTTTMKLKGPYDRYLAGMAHYRSA